MFFLFFIVSNASAQIVEEPFRAPGTAEGSGRHLEIFDSEYLNISLTSSEDITARIESAPSMIILDIKAADEAHSSNFVLSGLAANTTYHKYQDGYENYAPLVADGNGVVSFGQDISQNHIIFIQPRKSTKIIRNNATGGDCASIGSWNASSKTCALNSDVNETIQISDHDITLDGNGHAVTGTGTGTGINITSRTRVTIKNITIAGFFYGINFSYSSENKIIFVALKNNRNGINLNYSKNNIISGNSIIQSSDSGIKFFYSTGNTFSGNTINLAKNYGIFQSWQNYAGAVTNNTYENNGVTGNGKTGIYIYGGKNDVLDNNIISDNFSDGIRVVESSLETLSGNIMSGNKQYNFSVSGGDMSSNNIDTSNTVEAKSVYYIKNAVGESYDGIDNMGIFYCVNCEKVSLKSISLSANNAQIFFQQSNNSLVEEVSSPDKNIEVTFNRSNNNIVRKNTLGRMYLSYSNDNQIYNNNIMNLAGSVAQADFSERNLFSLDIPVGGNYWKRYASSCRDNNNDGFCDSPVVIGQKIIDNYPLVKEVDFDKPSCCSSVMFLPGHQASRLYKKDAYGEVRLWEPENKNIDVEKLFLDPDGESVDSGIYARDIMGEAYGIKNIYQGFSESMDSFVRDGVVNGWKPIPYDWRLPLEKIAEEGVKLENGGQMDIVEEIRKMAAASKTGKVTLVGHSNGGLLAKVLIERLREAGDEKLVDKLIMVGTPQLGTPKALAALLHGDEANLLHGLVLDKKTGRGFAENMVSAYNLLPSKKYFDTVQSPVVEFADDVKEIYDFRSLFGDSIDNWNEFKKFLLGDDGARTKPEASDLDSPNVLSADLLGKAGVTHDALDSWQAPEGLEVVQIAGWGLDTIRGIAYDDCDFPFCPDKLSNLDRSLLMTEDGDKTVVSPSAMAMSDVEKYYLNLKKHNEELIYLRTNREHADILEADELKEFIKNIIQNIKTLPINITQEKPTLESTDKRWRFRLHSPVAVDIYDENNNHTGFIKNNEADWRLYEEQIPNSYYTEFGETKYAGTGDSAVDVVLTGEDLGTFTFEIDQVAGDKVARNTTFANIPVMKDTRATLAVSETVSEMKIDVDGDGQTDATFQPGEEIKKADLLGILEKIVGSLDVEATVKDRLINKIDNAGKQTEKGNFIAANAMLENVKQQIEVSSREQTPEKFRLSAEDAGKLIGIIERILAMQ